MFKEHFRNNNQKIETDLNKSGFKYTSSVLYKFYQKCESIDNLCQLTESKANHYPLFILIRCQLEHFIVATYIFVQFRLTETDKTAQTYAEDYMIYEIIKRLNYSKSNKINMSSKLATLFQSLLDLLQKNGILKQKDIEDINRKGNQFDIKRISKFLDKNLPIEFDNLIKAERIKQFLEHYNYLSSFVHGGPSADAFLNEKINSELRKKVIEMKEWSSNIVMILRVYIIFFLATENENYETLLEKEINSVLKTGA